MKKFLLLYMSPVSMEDMMKDAKPEDMQKNMEPWMKWFDEHKEAIVDKGQPTGSEMNVTKTGSSKPSSFIGGYTIIQAEDMEAAKAMLADHPHYMMDGGSIEVLEIMPMPGM